MVRSFAVRVGREVAVDIETSYLVIGPSSKGKSPRVSSFAATRVIPDAGREPPTLALFAAAVFVLAAVTQEFLRGARARQAVAGGSFIVATGALVRRNRRRYGGYLVHVGVAVLLTGVAASSAFQHVRDVRLSPGQAARVGGYDIRYVRAVSTVAPEKVSLGAVLDISKATHHVAT